MTPEEEILREAVELLALMGFGIDMTSDVTISEEYARIDELPCSVDGYLDVFADNGQDVAMVRT